MLKQRRLGRTELLVSEVGVGCWGIGGPFENLGFGMGWDGIKNEDAKQGLIAAIKKGANIFDTADVYGLGQSERLLGEMLQYCHNHRLAMREDIVLISKVGYFKGCARHGFDPLHMKHQLELTLQNLGTEYLDIYFFHHLDFGNNNEYFLAAVNQMKEFKQKGLIRFLGLRGPHKFSPNRKMNENNSNLQEGEYSYFLKLVDEIDPDVISVRYNMITPTYDNESADVFRLAEHKDIGILIYKPLGQGLLLDKYDLDNPPKFSSKDHRNRKTWFRKKGLEILKPRLEEIKSRFNCKTTKDLVQLSIKYCLSRSENACVLVGFRNSNQIDESLSTRGTLSPNECDYIRTVFDGISEEIGEFID